VLLIFLTGGADVCSVRDVSPTPEVLRARRYAARTRILVALLGGFLLVVDRSVTSHPLAAALGLGVILATGVTEATSYQPSLLRVEEPVACLAGVLIVGFGEGRVNAISLLWLVAAGVGVLARGGRVGALGRVLILGTLFSPLVTRGTLSAENLGLAGGSILLLLGVGRLSRETGELLRRARYDADHDAMTDALNPRAYRAWLGAAAGEATLDAPLAVMLVDADDFGHVNRRHGYAAADSMIGDMVAALRARLEPGSVLARIDGDCFAAAAVSADPVALAEALRAAVAAVPVSVGVARAPRDGDDAEALLGAADVALRIAKRAGKARVVMYDGDPLTVSGPTGARGAIARLLGGDGLEMAVQPIVELPDGRIHAYEALARFRTRGGQGPLHWLALAEELGQRPELELACLRAALDLLSDLPGDAWLMANLSVPMLSDERVGAMLAGRPSIDRLVIEVTEEALARDDGSMTEALDSLRARGVRFAVDDIGAGYSGLRQLATLAPAYLKLDRSLVQGIESDQMRRSLVAALTGYASSTQALLVAEGVETDAELEVLADLGVPLVQGYRLARSGEPWPRAATVPAGLGLRSVVA